MNLVANSGNTAYGVDVIGITMNEMSLMTLDSLDFNRLICDLPESNIMNVSTWFEFDPIIMPVSHIMDAPTKSAWFVLK